MAEDDELSSDTDGESSEDADVENEPILQGQQIEKEDDSDNG